MDARPSGRRSRRGRDGRPARVFPLRDESLVALNRETGKTEWSRPIRPCRAGVGDGRLYVATAGAIRALDPSDGQDRWSTALEGAVTAPLLCDAGWLCL